MSKTKTIAFVGLLVSMEIIFTRFLSFQTPIIRIGFGFIPIAFQLFYSVRYRRNRCCSC